MYVTFFRILLFSLSFVQGQFKGEAASLRDSCWSLEPFHGGQLVETVIKVDSVGPAVASFFISKDS